MKRTKSLVTIVSNGLRTVKVRQTSNRCKRVLKAPKLACANKTIVYQSLETWF